ncbi:hypothetical protein DFP72DRAFT_604758 [Ephemerocybe angulata]|uniref:Protein MON2 homolog n=1 Tax=Ephemerocybe angulata TaxID=980116 RepID=A0A8H6LXD7_9AGAR|nr:hypothetical protein DFP72DRAFT_604758 [Tulosesus angulatus]
MSSLAFLVTELQSLASETRRRHPEIREAAEKSLAILRSSPEQATASLSSDGPQSEDLLKPVFMGCATKNAKVVAISLGSLQRLISLKAVPQSAVPLIVNTMSDAMSQGVDIQLRILQTLVSLIPNFPAIHGELLGDALLLCFKLQESRIAVVSSTAAATLRQLVMFVVDKMVYEDQLLESEDKPPFPTSEVRLPDGSTKQLGPSSTDAYYVFEDLCLLANSERPHFLKLESLHKTFALELVESVLTNYHDLFRNHKELILLLQHHLCPLLLKSMSDRPVFPLILRCTRVIFLLLKQFSAELSTEAEVFLMLLIRIITEDGSSEVGMSEAHHHHHVQGARPGWMRVIAMEIMRGICSDGELMRNIWDRYDSQDNGSKVFTSLLAALKRLLTEKPNLLGVCSQMGGVGVHSEGYGLDVGSVAGRVASATVSGVAGMIGVGGNGLSLQGSSMKLQCIDQLDKADAPPIPEPYIYLLAVQCTVSLCEGLASFAGPVYSTIVIQRPRAAGDAPIRAPPALDVSTLPQDDPQTKHLRIVQDIISNGWPALLAALSFIIATNLSDELFVEVLASYQALTNVSGMLGLATPRDAFFNSLAKFAVPTRVVSKVETYSEPPQTPRSATTAVAEGLGLGAAPQQPPGLSERNMACLKVLVGSALFLAGSLGESWYGVLETLQNADYVLTFKTGGAHGAVSMKRGNSLFGSGQPPSTAGPAGRSTSMNASQSAGSPSSSGAGAQRHPLLSDLEPETLIHAIQRLFDSSKNLEDTAFKAFVEALCKLSTEMVGMQSSNTGLLAISSEESLEDSAPNSNSLRVETTHRRRMSGIHIPKNQRSGDFGISKLGGVALSNIHRLIYRSPDIAWDSITKHLLAIIRLPYAPQSIRVQSAHVLDDILVVVPRNLSHANELQAQVQRRVLEVLSQQIIPDASNGYAGDTTTGVELRRMGLETLHQILQASGHTFVVGWEIVFQMLESVCKPFGAPSGYPVQPQRTNSTDSVSMLSIKSHHTNTSPNVRTKPLPLGLGNPTERSYSALVKIAFQSLTLVCDSVSLLSPAHLRLCIATLGQFGRQADTNIALTAAASLLWSVSDAIQAKRKDVDEEPEYSELWLYLLLEVLGLCTDSRPEVRDGAIQSLFRAMQLYGSTLNSDTWDQCIWKITFPLLDAITSEIRSRIPAADAPLDPSTGSPIRAWDESKILAVNSIGSIFHDFLVSKIILLDSFGDAWDAFVTRIQDCVLLDNRPVSAPALRCLERAVKAFGAAEGVLKPRVSEALQRVWEAIDVMGSVVSKRGGNEDEGPHQPFTQESLVAYVDVVQTTRATNGKLTGKEWELERLARLMEILKGVITYPNSPDYRPDIDALPPLQTVVMLTIESIDLSVAGSPSLVMKDMSEYATLAFLAAFDVQPQPNSHTPQTPQKRVTYIALSKKIMPMLVQLFMRFKASEDIYSDGTLEAVLSAYSIPIKLKYDCPSPSKFGKDEPLWKTATNSFLQIVNECTPQIKAFGDALSDERVEGLWWQILDVFRGGILADCSPAESFPLDVQTAEENFDLSLIASLEIDVIPHIGDSRVPDALVSRLGKILQLGSRLYESEANKGPRFSASEASSPKVAGRRSRSRSSDLTKVDVHEDYGIGKTEIGSLVPRERFSYWCFDLLFLICSNTTNEKEDSRKRLAALSLPALLNRCKATLVSYIADQSLRGGLPFPRAREEELVYALRKLLDLRLWPGSLWAAFSDEPSKHSSSQPTAADLGLSTPSELIADSVKRSPVAHLFHSYTSLCEIASTPGRTPTAWVSKSASSLSASARKREFETGKHKGKGLGESVADYEEDVSEVDARRLARDCLKEIGKELGV